jgi:hypothetical protein
MPMFISCSICSRESKTERSSILVPPSRSESRIRTLVVGMSALGFPSWSANPSVNSSALGGSTDSTRHQPRCVSPSGPVMK